MSSFKFPKAVDFVSAKRVLSIPIRHVSAAAGGGSMFFNGIEKGEPLREEAAG
ncbi:MAG: hypothetical protein HFH11_09560 [Dorea sp.]|jgi:hypothetical protein|nr:hypothetical protein [Dorea sp.]